MSFAAVYYSVLEVKLTVLCIHRDTSTNVFGYINYTPL